MDISKIKNLKDLLVVEQSEVTKVVAFDVNGNLVQGEYEKPDLTGYATEEWVKQELGNVQVDLSNYYTKDEVNSKVENVQVDLSNYYTKEEIDNTLGFINNVLTAL